MNLRLRNSILTALVLCCSAGISQTVPTFDITAYRQFLASHQGMSAEQLLAYKPAGTFAKNAPTNFAAARYSDSIQLKYALTAYERSLIETNGFMVTERLKRQSFGDAYTEIYNKDLPVFISTDAILHAIHMSYDAMLKNVEELVLIPKLDTLLGKMQARLPALSTRYASTPSMEKSLVDVDMYLTVARKLLHDDAVPSFPASAARVDAMIKMIKAQTPAWDTLFSSTQRFIDFSQFTPRGHYTQSVALTKYFQSMIWLGRTEMYLLAPENSLPAQSAADIQRQTIDAVLVEEAADGATALPLLETIDGTIRFFVGESDNVTLPNIRTLMQSTGTTSAAQLLDTARVRIFQDTLKAQAFAFQRILSQIIISDPTDPANIRPASSFLLLGQRFVIDSYVTGSVVYDKIVYNNKKVWRPLPSTLDVLFALGNDAAAQLLEPELSTYHYASNLASLRYLVDAYEPVFWQSTLYNNWLNSIRALRPPTDRSGLPRFMRTAPWWQQKMTTQLASWAQLRHDNLLYAKQSYTGGTTCSYPEGYVEPIPEFYAVVKTFAAAAAVKFQAQPFASYAMDSYWTYLGAIADTLGSIAQKELMHTPLTPLEAGFKDRMLFTRMICGVQYDGWYYRLFYTGTEGFLKEDKVVADVHTCPTDEAGNTIGWVLHAGTGPVNLAVVTTELPDGRLCSFVGPVLSYYEHVSTNFKRFTDEEWKTAYALSPSFRPLFVNAYLADSLGASRGIGPSLLTAVNDGGSTVPVPSTIVLGQNYPNPFNGSTVITFSLPPALAGTDVDLAIYDVQGRRVKALLHRPMPSGNFAVRWDGTNDRGAVAASGVYFYDLVAGPQRQVGKMTFTK